MRQPCLLYLLGFLLLFPRHLVCTRMFLYWSLFSPNGLYMLANYRDSILSLCITFKDSATLLILTADGLWLSTPYIVLAPVQHANLNWFCLFDQLTHFYLKRTNMYKSIHKPLNYLSSLHDSWFKLILLFAEMGIDEMSTSISCLHKFGAFLVRRVGQLIIPTEYKLTSLHASHTHCCFLSASFYPGPSSQEPHSWAQCSVLLCSHSTPCISLELPAWPVL